MKEKKITHLNIPTKIPKKEATRSIIPGLTTRGEARRLYTDLRIFREQDWHERVRAFEANPNSVYNAYWYIALHPMFFSFKQWSKDDETVPLVHERHLLHEQGWEHVRITPHMVNPADNKISGDPHLNTKVEWWYEFGPTLFQHAGSMSGLDHELMGGAKTYDNAIIKVAKAIHTRYGNDRRQVQKLWRDPELPPDKREEL